MTALTLPHDLQLLAGEKPVSFPAVQHPSAPGIRSYLATLAFGLAFTAFATPAHAMQEVQTARTGFSFGLRTGLMFPWDAKQSDEEKVDSDRPLASDLTALQVPLQLDIGYRPRPNVFLGVYAMGSRGKLSSDLDKVCVDELSCRVGTLSAGLQLAFSFRPFEKLDPWIGFGVGYETLRLHSEENTTRLVNSFRGIQGLAQGGLDINVSNQLSVGPYVQGAFGRFGNLKTKGGDMDDSAKIEDPGLHAWITVGVRVTLMP